MSTITPQIDDLHAILGAQRQSFLADGPPTLEQRRADLKKIRQALIANREAIEVAISTDFGHRSKYETTLLEIMSVIEGIKYLSRHLKKFMAPSKRHVALHMQCGSARVEYQPLGVVGVISPWNYPINLSLMPIVTAIAAGNRVMIKPSKHTPATNTVIAAMLSEIFPIEQVALVESGGAEFSRLPFDHLIFTGSTSVGRSVMQAASEHLVPVTLELGGKSPVIVSKGYPLKQAAARIVFGKLLNAGQTCIAPDYAMVHESEIDPFIGAYEDAVKSSYPQGPTSDDYTSIINEEQFTVLQELLEDAKRLGATIREVGVSPADASKRPHTMAPTIVLGVTDEMRISKEEIFGPILPIFAYDTIDEAIEHINARPRPLALYLFARDNADKVQVLTRTTSGNVTINGTILHVGQDDLPFGGVGASGMGAYHGREGFLSLSHAKGIYEQGRLHATDLLHPPYNANADRVIQLFIR